MSTEDARIRQAARIAMIKANIDTAREERRRIRESHGDMRESRRWTELIRQWKQELKALSGEEY